MMWEVDHDHAHSWCVARQSFQSNLLRKCGIIYENKFIFMPTYHCITLLRNSIKQLIEINY